MRSSAQMYNKSPNRTKIFAQVGGFFIYSMSVMYSENVTVRPSFVMILALSVGLFEGFLIYIPFILSTTIALRCRLNGVATISISPVSVLGTLETAQNRMSALVAGSVWLAYLKYVTITVLSEMMFWALAVTETTRSKRKRMFFIVEFFY